MAIKTQSGAKTNPRITVRGHPSITAERVAEAVERQMTTLDNPGFCVYCGEEQEGCEPDARRYECEHCGRNGVFGAEELLMYLT